MDKVICPHCGHKFEVDTNGMESGKLYLKECPICKETMEIYVELGIELFSRTVSYFKCQICGKKELEVNKCVLFFETENGE